MHGIELLHNWLGNACSFMHAARARALVKAVGGLLTGGQLTLTRIGRHLSTSAFTKHNIKCVDRLLGNRALWAERGGIYRAMARWLLNKTERPVLLIDWSDCAPGRAYLTLRAALPVDGRTVTVYEEVHRLARYNTPRVHRRFLRNLKKVLPEDCRPILVTDAGFRNPWFREVEARGWDWVARIRGRVKVSLPGQEEQPATALYARATPTPQRLGVAQLCASRPLECSLSLVHEYRRRPGRPRQHPRTARSTRGRQQHREPWLVATSLKEHAARWVIRLYRLRMKIEESFRDIKSHRFGFALRLARARRITRMHVLLLIAALATLVAILAGLVTKARGWTRHFQANTERREPVLSLFFLGRELLHSPRLRITFSKLLDAFRQLPTLIAEHSLCA